VAHSYAGILGPLAFLVSLARGMVHGGPADTVVWTAWSQLLVFTAIGYVLGWIAETVVDESVRSRIAAELGTENQPDRAVAPGAGGK